MKCPYCGREMVQGRISIFSRSHYNFYPETCFDTKLKSCMRKFVIEGDAIRLDRPRMSNFLGSEIEQCFHCADCKKIIIDIHDDQ